MSFFLMALVTASGCGSTEEASGGGGGSPVAKQGAYVLSCTIDTLVLEIPIELSFELDRPYSEDGSANLTYSAEVAFTEQASTILIDAGVSKIDIVSIDLATSVTGATPQVIETSLDEAPINDFDLTVDADDDGVAGPHRLELDTVTVPSAVVDDADEVVLSLDLTQVSLLLGDFHVPSNCLGPTLVGSAVSFSTGPDPDPSERQQPQER